MPHVGKHSEPNHWSGNLQGDDLQVATFSFHLAAYSKKKTNFAAKNHLQTKREHDHNDNYTGSFCHLGHRHHGAMHDTQTIQFINIKTKTI